GPKGVVNRPRTLTALHDGAIFFARLLLEVLPLKTVFAGLACILFACSAFAQSDRGAITGTVADGTGALIPGAKISLTNMETGAKFETVTTATGNYTAPGLPSGTYTLSVEHPGFSSFTQSNIRVQVVVTTRVDV